MKFENNNLVIMDNPELKNLIVPIGFFYNDDNYDNNDNMKLLHKIVNNNKTIDDDLYNKLFNLVDNNISNNKTKKTKNKNKNKNKNKTKNVKNVKNVKNKTKKRIKLK